MTTIRGAGGGPARPRGPDGIGEGSPKSGETAPEKPKVAAGLAGLSKDTFVTGGKTPTPPVAGQEPPKSMPPANLEGLDKAARGHFEAAASSGKLFESLSAKVDEVARLAESGDAEALTSATKEMQEMNQSFNLQYLQLQQNMQAENRQFTLISNIMKTKHDTAKAAIQNIR